MIIINVVISRIAIHWILVSEFCSVLVCSVKAKTKTEAIDSLKVRPPEINIVRRSCTAIRNKMHGGAFGRFQMRIKAQRNTDRTVSIPTMKANRIIFHVRTEQNTNASM